MNNGDCTRRTLNATRIASENGDNIRNCKAIDQNDFPMHPKALNCLGEFIASPIESRTTTICDAPVKVNRSHAKRQFHSTSFINKQKLNYLPIIFMIVFSSYWRAIVVDLRNICNKWVNRINCSVRRSTGLCSDTSQRVQSFSFYFFFQSGNKQRN